MVLCKNDEDLRETQRFMDTNAQTYLNLHPK